MDAYPTFLAVMWCAGLCLSQETAAFAGILYLFVRQKYFVGYMGQTSQSTPGFLFGKRIICFLFLMCVVGILNCSTMAATLKIMWRSSPTLHLLFSSSLSVYMSNTGNIYFSTFRLQIIKTVEFRFGINFIVKKRFKKNKKQHD
ncbi:hypothetical protein LDENG_00169810 [Lucifuga dentata]|nr:hypothetical protein LDENG_00169810 [Lucifuga dentata]